jgi:imidazolonepropionase-like amidohydrolase
MFGPECGSEGIQIKLLTECGMTPYNAIKCTTAVNATILRMADRIGSIKVDKWADIIVVDGHPDENANILANPVNVSLVMKKGDILKKTM